MELILAHHEISFQLIRYGLVLIGAGWICFKWLFPMIGRWIVDLSCKMQKKADPHSVSWKELRKREAQKREDDKCIRDGFTMTQDEIKDCHDSLEHI